MFRVRLVCGKLEFLASGNQAAGQIWLACSLCLLS
jgi:hypothetical protein